MRTFKSDAEIVEVVTSLGEHPEWSDEQKQEWRTLCNNHYIDCHRPENLKMGQWSFKLYQFNQKWNTVDPKCQRCWKKHCSVGQYDDHPTLCAGCVYVIREMLRTEHIKPEDLFGEDETYTQQDLDKLLWCAWSAERKWGIDFLGSPYCSVQKLRELPVNSKVWQYEAPISPGYPEYSPERFNPPVFRIVDRNDSGITLQVIKAGPMTLTGKMVDLIHYEVDQVVQWDLDIELPKGKFCYKAFHYTGEGSDTEKLQFMWKSRKAGEIPAKVWLEQGLDMGDDFEEIEKLRLEEMSEILKKPELGLNSGEQNVVGES